MSLTVILLIAGAIVGTGVWLLVREVLPTTPDLRSVLANLDPTTSTTPVAVTPTEGSDLPTTQRLGLLAAERSSRLRALTPPAADLELLERPTHQWLGEKLLCAFLGLLAPTAVTVLMAAAGLTLPWTLAGGAAIVLATAGWVLPDLTVRSDAAKVRTNATQPISVFYDMVLLEASSGSTVIQSLGRVAAGADSWLFVMIRDELARAALARHDAWEAITALGTRLQLPDLVSLGDTLRQGGQNDTSIITDLTAKATSLRDRDLNRAQEEANKVTQRLAVPVFSLAFLMVALVLYPSLIALASG